jgi:hypothetical protein
MIIVTGCMPSAYSWASLHCSIFSFPFADISIHLDHNSRASENCLVLSFATKWRFELIATTAEFDKSE